MNAYIQFLNMSFQAWALSSQSPRKYFLSFTLFRCNKRAVCFSPLHECNDSATKLEGAHRSIPSLRKKKKKRKKEKKKKILNVLSRDSEESANSPIRSTEILQTTPSDSGLCHRELVWTQKTLPKTQPLHWRRRGSIKAVEASRRGGALCVCVVPSFHFRKSFWFFPRPRQLQQKFSAF